MSEPVEPVHPGEAPAPDRRIPIGPLDCAAEEWRPVIGLEGFYEVSNQGRVRSIRHITKLGPRGGRVRMLQTDRKGYHFVQLWALGRMVQARVHQLVAQAFIPNPQNKPQVNHKDGNRKHNAVANLEWATNSENNQHAYDVLGRTPSRSYLGRTGEKHHASTPVIGTSLLTGEILTFPSMGQARHAGFNATCIWMCCTGRLKTHKGHRWAYARTSASSLS